MKAYSFTWRLGAIKEKTYNRGKTPLLLKHIHPMVTKLKDTTIKEGN